MDARGAADATHYGTTFDYTDHFGTPNGDARANSGATELGSQASYALPTKVTNALGHTVYAQYDYYLGRVVDTEDANGVVSSAYYNDLLDRPSQVIRALGTSVQSQTTFNYNDTNRIITSTSDQIAYGDNLLKSETLYDGLGRSTESRQYESANAYITTKQSYDALGRVSKNFNPYRAGETVFMTTTQYDALGRVLNVTTPDGAVVSTSYSGNLITVVDQAGKDRQSKTDALGRLTQVIEDPGTDGLNFVTTYGYDVLDNLTTVTQGSQSRSFVYDSLKRLILARNPEVTATLSDARASGLWSVKYDYDGNGNLTQKTDARAIVTTYGYDALNRATARSYSDGLTPAVTYSYDASGVPYSKGRLTSVSSSVSTTNYTDFDPMGRVKAHQQVTGGQSYQTGYGYDLAGHLSSETYPSGRIVSTGYDQAGRISVVNGQQSGEAAKTYASQFAYYPHGAVRAMQLGTQVTEETIYDVGRLQPLLIKLTHLTTNQSLLELHYNYRNNAPEQRSNNNGNVLHQTSVVDGVIRQQVYEYDSLNRLEKATEVNVPGGALHWQQKFIYDRYGNRNFDVGQTTPAMLSSNLAIDQSTNRYATGQGSILYDSAGNLTRDFNGHTFAYDAENKQTSYDGGQASYSYDGDGRRVKKVAGSETTIFVYDASGQLVAEYSNATPEAGSGGTSYLTSDLLGTPRVITDHSGAVKSRHDYLPFGEEISVGVDGVGDDGVRQKFTGYERDNETGLDYAQARYYNSAQGRFTSVDPLLASGKPISPKTWNRYTYALNNPLKFIDPTGLDPQWLTDGRRYFSVPDDQYDSYINQVDGDGMPIYAPAMAGTNIGVLSNVRGPSDFLSSNAQLEGNEVILGADGNFQLANDSLYGGEFGQEMSRYVDAHQSVMAVEFAVISFFAGPTGEMGSLTSLGLESGEAVARGSNILRSSFLGQASGPAIAVPEGAIGPSATRGAGVQYVGGNGGNGLANSVNNVRIMEPTTLYPNGYVNYGRTLPNGSWQTVNPYTGAAVGKVSSWWHIPLSPR